MENIKYNLSPELKSIINQAFEETRDKQYEYITLEQVLYVVVCRYLASPKEVIEDDLFYSMLQNLSVSQKQRIQLECEAMTTKAGSFRTFDAPTSYFDRGNISFSDELRRVFDRTKETQNLMKTEIGKDVNITTNDFILSALWEEDNPLIEIFKKYGISKESIMVERLSQMESQLKEKRITASQEDEDSADERFERAGEAHAINSKRVDPNSKTPALDQFAIDITSEAKEGKYDPVIGRDREIGQIIEILCCRKKNNVMITGCPGGGKSALVEKLAQKIASGNVPREIKGKRIFSLDLNALLAGCQFRGMYEERLQNVIKEVCENKNLIIFIDEAHNLIGNGSSGGTGDAANILKPYLARGEFQMIGSTTTDEYRKIIEKDGALKRRFSPVHIEEPNESETFEILKGLTPKYSEFHHVTYPLDVLKQCVEWSGKYIYDRFFPDKAIGVMDMAGSLAKLQNPEDTSILDKLEKEIEELRIQKRQAINEDDFVKAQEIRDKELETEKRLEEEKQKAATSTTSWPEVTVNHLASVISKISNIPEDKIINPEMEKLRLMKTKLKEHIIGQDEAIDLVSKLLAKSYLNLRDPNIPPSIMMMGGTGTGKTKLCEEIAETIFGDKRAMIRIDGGEYAQSHMITKLIGSPASFVGYQDSALLEKVRQRPHSLILWDEADKTHEEIFNTVLLNILSTGFVKLSDGTDVCFKDCIICVTGNTGTSELMLKGNGIGFGVEDAETKKKVTTETVMKAIKKKFKPEIINRFSGIVVFNSLGREEMKKIYVLELKKLQDRLQKRNYTLSVSDSMRDHILDCTDTNYGARDLSRMIAKWVEDSICDKMLEIDTSGKTKISVDWKDENVNIVFE